MIEQNRLNELLMDSLPHPAMLIRKDRTIIAANRIAKELGAIIGGLCWRDFGHGDYISDEDKECSKSSCDGIHCTFCIADKECSKSSCDGIHCTFCIADKALKANKPMNEAVHSFGKILDTYWILLENEIYLHYAIDITERKKIEEELMYDRALLSA